MHQAPSQCPTCGHALDLRELGCPECHTIVRGQWSPGPFSRLTKEQQTFLLIFVRSRGNLSEVERTLGVSYPTVRAKLEELIGLLSEPEPVEPTPAEASPRDTLLARIARGEIAVNEGLGLLSRLKEES